MAQNQNRRRRKRRGTQGGSVDARRRTTRPRSREEAKARARSSRATGSSARAKPDLPPTWRNSIVRGIGAAVIFALLLTFIFQRPVGASLALGAAMLAFYIPTGYYIDLSMWRKRERKRIRERSQ
jgi:hypothetical protein